MPPSRINALGVRLAKSTVPASDDLDLLTRVQDEYMQPLEQTGAILRERLNLADHGSYLGVALTASNRLKTTGPIIDKLRRKTRLSRMQDIVGYRIVGDLTIGQQDVLVAELRKCFAESRVVDRRARPMFGYRAVHIIADVDGFPVEIQVRTLPQDRWAQLMERFGDVYGREIRYGELPPGLNAEERRDVEATVKKLTVLGDVLWRFEGVWNRLHRNMVKTRNLEKQRADHGATYRIKKSLHVAEIEMRGLRREHAEVDQELTEALKRVTG